MRISYSGSRQQYAPVQLQGVLAQGAIDSGTDITIVGGELFRRVAAVAKLRKGHLKKVDKVPHTYDQKTFPLDGRVDLDVTFGDLTMKTPIYTKMDAPESLLLAEGVCRQLNIITYHPDVVGSPTGSPVGVKSGELGPCDGLRDVSTKVTEEPQVTEEPHVPETPNSLVTTDQVSSGDITPTGVTDPSHLDKPSSTVVEEVAVPTVRVWLSHSVRLLPGASTLVPLRLEEEVCHTNAVLLEGDSQFETSMGQSFRSDSEPGRGLQRWSSYRSRCNRTKQWDWQSGQGRKGQYRVH